MISIVVPLYNGERFITQTIEAVESQTYQDYEIIISDDCSTDSSLDVIRPFLSKHNVRLIKSESNQGACINSNRAVQFCQGEYLMILGQDDLITSNHIESMLCSFSSKDVVAVFCDYNLINQEGNIFDTSDHCRHREIVISDFFRNNAVPSCGLVMRTNAFRKVLGYPESVEWPLYGEYGLWIRLLKIGRIVFNKDVRSMYRRHDNNISNEFTNPIQRKVLERYFNSCRKYIFSNYDLSIFQKSFLGGYIFYKRMKMLID